MYRHQVCVAAHVPILYDTQPSVSNDCCTGPQSGCDTVNSTANNCVGGGNRITGEIGVYDGINVLIGGSPARGNTITSKCAGLKAGQDNRRASANVTNSYNTINLDGVHALVSQLGFGTASRFNIFSQNVTFDHNTYNFLSSADYQSPNTPWAAQNDSQNSISQVNWSGWQAGGHDANGHVTP
jgi:hypothetical protein